eukprot:gnl/TRDRNA2_/TRDRNA2_173251_c0_seq3.p1 gnl/TRDRNA2_/TRDRNA2_173251_c0~~gnl/TRDRNA2_/TRDRNA2_173251_c0_seq3.p1  ORF type:complete len:320 (-),score=38.78 gnl/TRDRNA2_/TRDRNA2_173251_c0_seq3:89-1048(-)
MIVGSWENKEITALTIFQIPCGSSKRSARAVRKIRNMASSITSSLSTGHILGTSHSQAKKEAADEDDLEATAVREAHEELADGDEVKRTITREILRTCDTISFSNVRIYIMPISPTKAKLIQEQFATVFAERNKKGGVCNTDGLGYHSAEGPDGSRSKPGYFFPRTIYTDKICDAIAKCNERDEHYMEMVRWECLHAENAVDRFHIFGKRHVEKRCGRDIFRRHLSTVPDDELSAHFAKQSGLCEMDRLERLSLKWKPTGEMYAWFSVPNEKPTIELALPSDLSVSVPVCMMVPGALNIDLGYSGYWGWDLVQQLAKSV